MTKYSKFCKKSLILMLVAGISFSQATPVSACVKHHKMTSYKRHHKKPKPVKEIVSERFYPYSVLKGTKNFYDIVISQQLASKALRPVYSLMLDAVEAYGVEEAQYVIIDAYGYDIFYQVEDLFVSCGLWIEMSKDFIPDDVHITFGDYYLSTFNSGLGIKVTEYSTDGVITYEYSTYESSY